MAPLKQAMVQDFKYLQKSFLKEYGLHKSNLIAHVSFADNNILSQKRTGCKQMVNYNSHVSLSGSFIYIKEWLGKQSEVLILLLSG